MIVLCVCVQSAVDALTGGASDCTVCVQSAVDALTGGAIDYTVCVYRVQWMP